MRILRIMIGGQLIAWEVSCTYGYDSISVKAFTGENLAGQKSEGLTIGFLSEQVGNVFEVQAAIGIDDKYTIEYLGKYKLKSVKQPAVHPDEETPYYFIQLNQL